MIAVISKIRLLQGYRVLREMGLLRVLFLGGLGLVMSISAYHGLLKVNWEIPISWAVLLLAVQVQRGDLTFLRHLEIKRWQVLLLEYGLLTVPLALVLIEQGRSLLAGIALLEAIALAFWSPQLHLFKRKGRTTRLQLLHPAAFEWKAGIRQYGWLIVLIWIAGMALSKYEPFPLLCLFGIALTSASFYAEGESREMLEAIADQPGALIRAKVGLHLRYFGILAFPLCAMFLINFIHLWYFLLLLLFICVVFQVLAIVLKYALYVPNEPINGNLFSMWLGFCTACLAIPFMQPIPLIMLVRFYNRAQQNLQNYLHAHDSGS